MTDKPEIDPRDEVYVSLAQVMAEIPLSESTIRRKIRRDEFPKPVQIAPHRVAFWKPEIMAHKRAMLEARDSSGKVA